MHLFRLISGPTKCNCISLGRLCITTTASARLRIYYFETTLDSLAEQDDEFDGSFQLMFLTIHQRVMLNKYFTFVITFFGACSCKNITLAKQADVLKPAKAQLEHRISILSRVFI